MIERYVLPEMGNIWTDENRFQKWLEVELAVLENRATHGQIPRESLEEIKQKVMVDADEIRAIEGESQHDVIAFVSSLAKKVGPSGRYIHQGLTSSDVVDTALSMMMKESLEVILRWTNRVAGRLKELAFQHKDTVMIGRTHGIHAEPTTFGLKLALWYRELRRQEERLRFTRTHMGVGKISGAVGTYTHLSPDMEEEILALLNLDAAPISSQVIQRDRHAFTLSVLALAGASLEKFATEIRHLARTEVRELEEPFRAGQKGSSAMPHKRNPVLCERVCGLARLLRGYSVTAMENIPLWHERDISHSSAERVIIPDAFIALHYMLSQFDEILAGLKVYPARMQENLERTRGLVFSGKVLTRLIDSGMDRDTAYKLVQEQAMLVWDHPDMDLPGNLRKIPQVTERLTEEDLARCFDLGLFLAHVDQSLDRALEGQVR